MTTHACLRISDFTSSKRLLVSTGHELPPELIQNLLRMAPTSDEQLKLRHYVGELGPAERFLKELVGVPFAFKRLECLLFMTTFQDDMSTLQESFAVLEVRK